MEGQRIGGLPVFYTLPTQPPFYYHDPGLGTLAYDPLPVHSQQQLQQELLPAVDHQGLSLAAWHPLAFRQQQLVPQTLHLPRQIRTMAEYQSQGITQEEMEQMQKLSNEYEPEVTGPLVAERQPSSAITTEYASADPVFQAKTAALPQSYSHYRKIRGDGRCGWRAVSFGYFETLIRFRDVHKFLEEEARLRSLNNVLNAAGFDALLYEDFVDATFDVLRKVANAMQTGGDPDQTLLDEFNLDDVQNYVMTHFKTLTAAWMKTHQHEYAPFIQNQTLEDFCNGSVMPIGCEIDNVGLSALKDVLLSPASITLEVIYLDRSKGDQATSHQMPPSGVAFSIGTIRLLYRPGHYDMLYKREDVPPEPAQHTTVPSFLQYGSYQDQSFHDIGNSDFMTLIPGMSFAPASNHGYLGSGYYDNTEPVGASPPMQPLAPVNPTPSTISPRPQMRMHSMSMPAGQAHLVPPPNQMPQELAIRTVSNSTIPPYPGSQQTPSGPFRPSLYQYQADFGQLTPQTPLQTSIFKNSHYNTAHFMNPEFQPEEWRPDDDYVTTSSSRSSRHRSSG